MAWLDVFRRKVLPASLDQSKSYPGANRPQGPPVTNPIVTTLEQAALPTAVVALKALQTLVNTLATADPAQLPVVAPAALQIFLGTVELQAPSLAVSELTAVGVAANTTINGWITKLQAAQTPPS